MDLKVGVEIFFKLLVPLLHMDFNSRYLKKEVVAFKNNVLVVHRTPRLKVI
jgi:hypothetical protein